MLQFVKDSIRELKHVVWPTHAETKKYLTIVLVVLVLFGAYLFAASTVFSEVLYGIKDVVNPSEQQEVNLGDITAEDIQIETNQAGEISEENTEVSEENTVEAQ
ncbi:MAG: preprotein translocase subunit SecE [Patescibacteria group bacterium]